METFKQPRNKRTGGTVKVADRRRSPRDADKRKFVPHNIQLKMQWDKFSTDSEESLRKLEHELLTSLVDHINDRRYYTYAPISLTVKPDYFTNGVKLFAGFETGTDDEREVSLDVTVPQLKVDLSNAQTDAAQPATTCQLRVRFEMNGKSVERSFEVTGGRRLSIGRGKENDIALDDASVSKMHASLKLDAENRLVVADTGSTNGTFIDGERIAYGKAIDVLDRSHPACRYGKSGVSASRNSACRNPGRCCWERRGIATVPRHMWSVNLSSRARSTRPQQETAEPGPTAPSIPMPKAELLKPLETAHDSAEAGNGLVDPDDDTSVTK